MFVLDIGCGKDWTKWITLLEKGEIDGVTCVDSGYPEKLSIPEVGLHLIRQDIFRYLETLSARSAELIYAERVFEHISYDQISYLLYLLYECSVEGAELVITVPDFGQVGKSIIDMDHISDLSPQFFNKWMIDVHTEIFNTKEDPHQSIWTIPLARYYIELEDYWELNSWKQISRDNRDWYIEFRAKSTRKTIELNDIKRKDV